MKVTLEYFGMLREAAGLNQEDLELPAGADAGSLVQFAAERHGEPLRSLLLSAEEVPHPWLLIAIDDVVESHQVELAQGSHVLLSSPISGG